MELEYSEERRLLKESVERFVRERYDFAQRGRILESAKRFDPGVWSALAGFGWLGLPLPEAHGGFGGAALDVGIVMEGFGRGLVLEPYLSTVVLGAGLIDAAGTDAQRARWLPQVAAGELRLALAHAESMRRTLDTVPATTAVRSGGGWVLDGAKRLVLDAPGADGLLVSAIADGRCALFLVPAQASGLALTPWETLDGRLAADVALTGVRVDDAARLAGVEDAGEALAAAIDRAIAATCAEAVGCMQVLLDDTVAYTKTRVQFDRPIAANQVLRHRMVDMAIHLEEARAMAWRAALHADAAPGLRRREVSGARLKIARAARFVGENAVQLHGAMGVTEELNVGAYVKRLMAIERSFGTTAEHQDRIAAMRAARAAA